MFVTIALKRSGQHAVIDWLGYNLQSALHLNHCGFIRKGLGFSPAPLAGRFISYRDGERIDSKQHDAAESPGTQDVLSGAIEKLAPYENIIYSFEDHSLENRRLRQFIRRYNPTVLLILRDPYNCLASSFKHHNGRNSFPALELKKKNLIEYLKQVLKIEDYLQHEVHGIDYGKWFCNDEYKNEILKTLNISGSSAVGDSLGKIQPFGGGSSFDSSEIDIEALKIRSMERWKVYQHDPDYLRLIEDPELRELSEHYFEFKNPFARSMGEEIKEG